MEELQQCPISFYKPFLTSSTVETILVTRVVITTTADYDKWVMNPQGGLSGLLVPFNLKRATQCTISLGCLQPIRIIVKEHGLDNNEEVGLSQKQHP
jgi:hypothetical protein